MVGQWLTTVYGGVGGAVHVVLSRPRGAVAFGSRAPRTSQAL